MSLSDTHIKLLFGFFCLGIAVFVAVFRWKDLKGKKHPWFIVLLEEILNPTVLLLLLMLIAGLGAIGTVVFESFSAQ